MPPFSRIAREAAPLREDGSGLVLRTQGAGDAGARPLPPGTERVEGAFETLGLMIAGLMVLFAVVLLVMRARRNR
ncbi:MAG TPA: hypothetical protein VK434_03170 [Microvirga sp.]|jgi:hypothetical protein|nr:hypothetical protein [Microvirga sp.]